MDSNQKISKWSAAAVILLVVVTVFVMISRQGQPVEPGLVAQIGDYKIFQSDIDDKISFEKCLNRELNPTRALGILFYFGFLENIKQPLKTDVAQADIDKEYSNLETNRVTSFMSITKDALNCLTNHFGNKRASFDKVVIRPVLLNVSIQKAFAGPLPNVPETAASLISPLEGNPPGIPATSTPTINMFGTKETFYDWYTGYLKVNVKIKIYQPQVCKDVKSLYKDDWFKGRISC